MRVGTLSMGILFGVLGASPAVEGQPVAVLIEYDLEEYQGTQCIPDREDSIRATTAVFDRETHGHDWFNAGTNQALYPVVRFFVSPDTGGHAWSIQRKSVAQLSLLPDTITLQTNPFDQRVNRLDYKLDTRQTWRYEIHASKSGCPPRKLDPQIVFNGGGGGRFTPLEITLAALATLFAVTTLWLLWHRKHHGALEA